MPPKGVAATNPAVWSEKMAAVQSRADDTRQIKSRERVRTRGEVFTAPREVNAMLDLVKDETSRIESTFLEPACGDGNFLDEVLRRKLAVCRARYGKSATDYEKFSFLACTSLYGVDIMADNVARCRTRLFETWEESFCRGEREERGEENTPGKLVGPGGSPGRVVKSELHEQVARAVRFVFERNILLGNALSLKCVDDAQRDLDRPLVFTEWKFAVGDKIKREEYRFDVLLESGGAKAARREAQMTLGLFDEPSDAGNWMVDPDDPERKRMIPAPSKRYESVDYWRLGEEI